VAQVLRRARETKQRATEAAETKKENNGGRVIDDGVKHDETAAGHKDDKTDDRDDDDDNDDNMRPCRMGDTAWGLGLHLLLENRWHCGTVVSHSALFSGLWGVCVECAEYAESRGRYE
jgi:hypothetical protein